MITVESEEEIVTRKFGVWKIEMKTGGLRVNINKTKLNVMGREPAIRPQRGRYPHVGFVANELEQTHYNVNVVKSGASRDV